MALKPGSYMPRSGHMHMQQVTGTGDSSHCTTPLLAQPIGADPPPDVQPNLRTAPPSRPHRACHRAAYAPHAPLRCARVRARGRAACAVVAPAAAASAWREAARTPQRRCAPARAHCRRQIEDPAAGPSTATGRSRPALVDVVGPGAEPARGSLRRNAAGDGRLEKACGATRPREDGSRKPAAQRGRGWPARARTACEQGVVSEGASARESLRRNAAGDGR